jgi:energy-coupling factor transporter ATP-binding protein EcfA2
VIRVESLVHRYADGTPGLDGVDLHVERGEAIGLGGRNGSGKTTLLRHLVGLLRPASGRVLIDGADIRDRRVAELARQVGLVFQEPADQLFRSTVRGEVEFASASPEATDGALATAGLSDRGGAHPYDLGYSKQKLLTIAAVVAMGTPIVVLDEPTLGQDAAGRDRVAGFLRQLRAAGRTVIVAGHDRALMAAELDRTLLMVAGRLAGQS